MKTQGRMARKERKEGMEKGSKEGRKDGEERLRDCGREKGKTGGRKRCQETQKTEKHRCFFFFFNRFGFCSFVFEIGILCVCVLPTAKLLLSCPSPKYRETPSYAQIYLQWKVNLPPTKKVAFINIVCFSHTPLFFFPFLIIKPIKTWAFENQRA